MIPRRGIANGVLQAPFNVKSLFAKGEQGVWYDPSDLSTLFQDAAGTTPVTAVGQPVGLMLDKSGRGTHATQAKAASRPILQQDASGRYYLSCDGVDDGMATASIDFTATDKMTVWAGIRKLSDTTTGTVVELSANLSSNSGSFLLRAPRTSPTNTYGWFSMGTALADNSSISGFTSPISSTVTGIGDIPASICNARVNGVTYFNSTSQGIGNYGNYPLYLFRRGGANLPFNGNFYGLVIRGAQTTPKQISQVEKYLAAKTGVSI